MTTCPMDLHLNGHPCGCGGQEPSHYWDGGGHAKQQLHWEEVRDTAVAIAEARLRRGVLTASEIRDALDEAYRAGQEAGK